MIVGQPECLGQATCTSVFVKLASQSVLARPLQAWCLLACLREACVYVLVVWSQLLLLLCELQGSHHRTYLWWCHIMQCTQTMAVDRNNSSGTMQQWHLVPNTGFKNLIVCCRWSSKLPLKNTVSFTIVRLIWMLSLHFKCAFCCKHLHAESKVNWNHHNKLDYLPEKHVTAERNET